MSTAYCIACASDMVVDPTGRCANGHEVGRDGNRVAAALASNVPHPDEPEPWVGQVVLDDSELPAPEPVTPRPVAPPSVPGITPSADAAARAQDDAMSELSALSDLAALLDQTPAAMPAAQPLPTPSPGPVPSSTVPASTPPPPAPSSAPSPGPAPAPHAAPAAPAPVAQDAAGWGTGSGRSALDELADLEAAMQQLTAAEDPPAPFVQKLPPVEAAEPRVAPSTMPAAPPPAPRPDPSPLPPPRLAPAAGPTGAATPPSEELFAALREVTAAPSEAPAPPPPPPLAGAVQTGDAPSSRRTRRSERRRSGMEPAPVAATAPPVPEHTDERTGRAPSGSGGTSIDISNFTAQGNLGSGRPRRFFGR